MLDKIVSTAVANETTESLQNTFQKLLIEKALEKHRYNQTKAAKMLGMNRGTFRKYAIQYNLI